MAFPEDGIARTPPGRDEDEGLFSRDIAGQLVRVDAPTEADYAATVALTIDGRAVTVPLAEPLRDSQGNVVLDRHGRTTPRRTTVLDAVARGRAGETGTPPIPTLCHQPHMTPVGVCRVCLVRVYGAVAGSRRPERRLLPACHLAVKPGMEVFTIDAPGPDGDAVRRTVRGVTELLAAEHLRPAPAAAAVAALELNELAQVVRRVAADPDRFRLPELSDAEPVPAIDDSSPVFVVDRSACILCDRCTRACGEVTQNHVLGRAGKADTARIGFDLDVPMGASGCVQCGECMVACPTTAILFKPMARVEPRTPSPSVEVVAPERLVGEPVLSGVPPKFLAWQQGLVASRRVVRGEYLCRAGEAGNTAFLIRSGSFEVASRWTVGPEDVIVGEMACLSGAPRSADVRAREDSEVWELRRNVLERVMRAPELRARFEDLYRRRALSDVLSQSPSFRSLPADEHRRLTAFLEARLTFVRVSPGQVIYEQGEEADRLFLVRLGHVQLLVAREGTAGAVVHRGPGSLLGEMELLPIARTDAKRPASDVERAVLAALSGREPAPGPRMATCSALDHVELVQVARADVLAMVRELPALRRRLIERSQAEVRRMTVDLADAVVGDAWRQYIDQGLYQGRSLLAIDLERCTRCDLCTQACVDQHGVESHGVPFARMLREGRRFGSFLVATACRSCTDAYCLVGCPVDAIHRGRHRQIVIEDHCIGCGLCARNCPYGNIFMVHPLGVAAGTRAAQPRAATCDLCDPHGREPSPDPRCVYACPHRAAFRLTGPELMRRARGIDPEEA